MVIAEHAAKIEDVGDMRSPAIHYAKSGDVHVAYQVFGSGTIDLVFVPGWISHLDFWWDSPVTASWFERLARFSRVILFDKRGTGLSDRIGGLPSMDQRMDDIRAVMDAAESKRGQSWAYRKAVRLRPCSRHHTQISASH